MSVSRETADDELRPDRSAPRRRQASPCVDGVRTAELEDRAARLLRELDDLGYLVTSRGEIEAAAVARLAGVELRTLRSWRDIGLGPWHSRTVGTVALYPINDVLEWLGVDAASTNSDDDRA